jgi:glycosyltransferase involved in cell wall biosynthesis
LAAVVRRLHADVIHARNTGCWADAVVASLLVPGVRLVLGLHGLETDEAFNRRQRLCVRVALRRGARFTSVSEAGRRQLREQARVPANRVDVLGNGVDLRRFYASNAETRRRLRAALRLDDETFAVGTVGALTPVKDHATLLRAVARAGESLPDLRLLIVGDGPLRADLERQARLEGMDGRVRFTGWRDDIPALLACLDAYVCSSTSEGMSNAVLEAMAAGLSIIATDVGDNALLVRDGVEGLIVPRASHTAVIDALTTLVSTPATCRAFATAAKARAREYDLDRTVRRYEAYYARLASPRVTQKPAGPVSKTVSLEV